MPRNITPLVARDVMVRDPICVDPSTPIRELARVFEVHEISGAPVVDSAGRVVGVVSKSDLIRRCQEGLDDQPPAYLFEVIAEQGGFAEEDEEESPVIPEPLICVEDFMTSDPVCVSPETPVSRVAALMFKKRIHRAIVTDRAQVPVGIITSLDLLGHFPPRREVNGSIARRAKPASRLTRRTRCLPI